MENDKDGNKRAGREIGPGLLLVVLVALRVMRQAIGRIVRLRAHGLVTFGGSRGNRDVFVHRQICNAGTNGGSDVVREEHRRQK